MEARSDFLRIAAKHTRSPELLAVAQRYAQDPRFRPVDVQHLLRMEQDLGVPDRIALMLEIPFFNPEVDAVCFIQNALSDVYHEIKGRASEAFEKTIGLACKNDAAKAALLLPAFLGDDFQFLDRKIPVTRFGEKSGWNKTVYFFRCNFASGRTSEIGVHDEGGFGDADARRVKFISRLYGGFFDMPRLMIAGNTVMADFVDPPGPGFSGPISRGDIATFDGPQEEELAGLVGIHARGRFMKHPDIWETWNENSFLFFDENSRLRNFIIDLEDDHFFHEFFMAPVDEDLDRQGYMEYFSEDIYKRSLWYLTALPGWADPDRRSKIIGSFENSFLDMDRRLKSTSAEKSEIVWNISRYGWPHLKEVPWADREAVMSCYLLHAFQNPHLLLAAIYDRASKEATRSFVFGTLSTNRTEEEHKDEIGFWAARTALAR